MGEIALEQFTEEGIPDFVRTELEKDSKLQEKISEVLAPVQQDPGGLPALRDIITAYLRLPCLRKDGTIVWTDEEQEARLQEIWVEEMRARSHRCSQPNLPPANTYPAVWTPPHSGHVSSKERPPAMAYPLCREAWFYLDEQGNRVDSPEWADCSGFYQGYALVLEKDGMAYLVDRDFNKVTEGYPAASVSQAGGMFCLAKGGLLFIIFPHVIQGQLHVFEAVVGSGGVEVHLPLGAGLVAGISLQI